MVMKQIYIKEQSFVNNGDLILPSIKDASGVSIEESIKIWLNQNYDVKESEHTEKGVSRIGYDAKDINKVLRTKMKVVSGIHEETYVEYGCILHSGEKGFDFSLYDEEYYSIKLRNAFIGNPGMYKGEDALYDLNKRVLKSDGKTYNKSDWKKKVTNMGGTPGENIIPKKSRYTMVGEIQFGNWAIVRHDLLRLLNASLDGEIDYYVYITATGNLEEGLSEGIVTYSEVLDLFYENKQLVRMPVWVIGLDIK